MKEPSQLSLIACLLPLDSRNKLREWNALWIVLNDLEREADQLFLKVKAQPYIISKLNQTTLINYKRASFIEWLIGKDSDTVSNSSWLDLACLYA